MTPPVKKLCDNVHRLMSKVQRACEEAGREPSAVQLVAVTKYVDTGMAVALANVLAENRRQHGWPQTLMLGENRPQVLQGRWLEWGDGPDVQWHLIGSLQTNKIKVVVPRVHLIHSLDRVDLLDRLQRHAAALSCQVSGLLEFRISPDESKHGWSLDQVSEILALRVEWPNVRLCGVMGMSGLDATPVEARRQFERLAECFDYIKGELPAADASDWRELSMGMTGDLSEAIAAGSTMVRIGTALFEGCLPKTKEA